MKTYIFALICCMTVPLVSQAQPSSTTVTVNLNNRLGPMEISRFSVGQGGFSSEPMFAEDTAQIRALRPQVLRLFVQDYYNLLPAPGKYHFSTLDISVDLILRTGATPLLCLTFKPKVLFPRIDQNLTEPTSWTAWDKLVYNLVLHYEKRNGGGWYWEVGNEFDRQDGGGAPYHMTPAQYTRFYAHTVAAIRRADPQARVGGPALADYDSKEVLIPALLAFCNKNKVPLDFVSWHGYKNDPQWFRKSIESIHEQLKNYPGLHPETVIDEWNIALGQADVDPRFQPAFVAETTFQMLQGGLDLSCYYQIRDYPFADDLAAKFYPERYVADEEVFWDRQPAYLGLFDYENQVRPAYFVFRMLERLTGDRVGLESSSQTVHGLATVDKSLGVSTIMLWNYSDKATDVDLDINNMPANGSAWRFLLDATGPDNDDTARLRPQPVQKLPKGNGRLSFPLKSWGVTLISLEEH
jgi:hypothetical protein